MNKNYIFNFSLLISIFLIISNIISFIYRYSKMPVWLNLFQGSVLFIILLYLILLHISKEPLFDKSFFARAMIVFSFISKGLIAIINEHIAILPDLSDVSYYNNLALDFARENVVQGSGLGASGFANYFIGNIYLLLGNSSLVVSLINSFLYSITIIYIIKICFEFKILNPWPAAFIAAFMPSSILYIPVLLRESAFLFISILFFYRLVILYNRKVGSMKNHSVVLAYLFLATFIRPQVFPIYSLIYVLSLIYFYRGIVRVSAIFTIVVFLFVISISNFKLFLFIDSNLLNLYYFQLYRNAFSDLPNAYLVNIVYKDWFDFISYIPRFLIHYLFAPYPWESSNYKYFMATLDSIFSFIILVGSLFIIIGNFKIFKTKTFQGAVLFLILTVPFAMIEAYPMGAVRHRMIVLLLMLPIFSFILPINIDKFKKMNN